MATSCATRCVQASAACTPACQSSTRVATPAASLQTIPAEGIDVLLKAWNSPGPWSHKGKYYNIPEMRITPSPVQKPIPFYVASFSQTSLQMAARRGLHIIYAPFAAGMIFGGLDKAADAYNEACVKAGVPVISRYRPGKRPACTSSTSCRSAFRSAGKQGRAEYCSGRHRQQPPGRLLLRGQQAGQSDDQHSHGGQRQGHQRPDMQRPRRAGDQHTTTNSLQQVRCRRLQ